MTDAYRVVRFWGSPSAPVAEVEIARVPDQSAAFHAGFDDMIQNPTPPAGYETSQPRYGLRPLEEAPDVE